MWRDDFTLTYSLESPAYIFWATDSFLNILSKDQVYLSSSFFFLFSFLWNYVFAYCLSSFGRSQLVNGVQKLTKYSILSNFI